MVAFKLFSLAALVGVAVAADDVKLRYMPFGDSITEIICWRAKLWEKLQGTEWATVDWVGSGKTDNNCRDTKVCTSSVSSIRSEEERGGGLPRERHSSEDRCFQNGNPSTEPWLTRGVAKYDKDNEGHSGFLAINIANNKQLVGWLKKNPADVITMHLGTNDIVQQNKPTADIIAAFTTLVGVMRDSNPRMKIVVSEDPRCKVHPSSYPPLGSFDSLSFLDIRSPKSSPWAWEASTRRSRI